MKNTFFEFFVVIVVFFFFFLFFFKKCKLSDFYKTWDLVEFKYAEFDGDLYFFCFGPKIPFWGKFGPKNQFVKGET